MLARLATLSIAGCLFALGATACKSECQDAADRICEDQQECGFAIDCEREIEECSEAEGAAWSCLALCFEAAPCEALDGRDPEAAQQYIECAEACGEVSGI